MAENFAFAFQNATAIVAYRDIKQIQRVHYEKVLIEIQDKKNEIDKHLQTCEGYKSWTASKIDQDLTIFENNLMYKH